MSAIPTAAVRAANRYGHLVDALAAGYTNPVTGKHLTGAALLLKLSKGENNFRLGGAPSSAGARGPAQFTPGSRQVAIDKFGLDPWKNDDQAFHAAALHLLGKINGAKGLAGYNPGMASYTDYILGQRIGSVPGGGGSSGGAAHPKASVASGAPQQGSGAASALLQALISAQGQAQPRAVLASAPPAPSFSAAPTLAAGAQVPVAQPVQQPDTSLDTTLAAIASLGPQQQDASSAAPGSAGASSSSAASRSPGKVVVAPGAERGGVGLQKPILGFLHALSSVSGRPVTVTTGTNHNQYVVGTKRQSDHWDGNAADLGVQVDSKQGDLIAAHAIQLAGKVPFAKALAMARKGGVFNFETKAGRVQVLWRTYVGGDHHNHVHVGLNPNR